jgi:adenylate cyclase
MTDVPDDAELRRLGLYDPNAPGADDLLNVVRLVFELGATPEEAAEAARINGLGDLALDLAMRPPGLTQDLDTFADASDDPDLVRQMWRALGLPEGGPVRVTPDMAEGLRLLVAASAMFNPGTALAIARVIGSSCARMAEALVSAVRVDVELPMRVSGTPYSASARESTAAARELLPPFLGAVNAVFRRHMVLFSYYMWSTDEERTAVTHIRTVGFADLVGSTEAVRAGSIPALAMNVRQFEELAWDVVTRAGGRVVKLIGDEAMFVVEEPSRACAVALDLVERSPHPIRVGLAQGTVVALYGDYYGETVNLAARLVDVAQPWAIAVSDSVRRLADGDASLSFDDLGRHALKGFGDQLPVHLVKRAAAGR